MENSSNQPKFHLGRVVMTAGIDATIASRSEGFAWLTQCLGRHMFGDWGDVDPHDAALNQASASDDQIDAGARVLSVYTVPADLYDEGDLDNRIWIVTSTEAWDADTPIRATTILWPSEY